MCDISQSQDCASRGFGVGHSESFTAHQKAPNSNDRSLGLPQTGEAAELSGTRCALTLGLLALKIMI